MRFAFFFFLWYQSWFLVFILQQTRINVCWIVDNEVCVIEAPSKSYHRVCYNGSFKLNHEKSMLSSSGSFIFGTFLFFSCYRGFDFFSDPLHYRQYSIEDHSMGLVHQDSSPDRNTCHIRNGRSTCL